ncbi:hypothetical protein F2Q69_00044609 [Brassica cretica]|uniref:Auxin-responsive protein n=1 Tax=Brassica cretica TaxID=69181 RepID=A0A8S9N7E6_BRACR|nr:hypothetical protein F2Q69_00044609 [Brassica cretica]
MAFVRSLLGAKKILGRSATAAAATSKSATSAAPKGFLAVYVGEGQKKRYVVPVSYLSQPSFQASQQIRRRVWVRSSNGWLNDPLS